MTVVPRISVIIPVYNSECYLYKCLSSLRSQSFTDLELICIDDGSTDDSATIINEFVQSDQRFKYIYQKNTGLSGARNTGIKAATGEFIAFIDADDWVKNDTYKIMYDEMTVNNVDLVIVGMECFDETESNTPYPDSHYSLKHIKVDNRHAYSPIDNLNFLFQIPVSACNKLFKKKIIDDQIILFPTGLIFEDNPFFYKYYLQCELVCLIDKNLYCRRVRNGSITTSNNNSKYLDIFKILNLIEQILIEKSDIWKKVNATFLQHQVGVSLGWLKKTSYRLRENFYVQMREYFSSLNLNLYEVEQLAKTKEGQLLKLVIDEKRFYFFSIRRLFLPAVIKDRIPTKLKNLIKSYDKR